jgi:hypothetical protein
MKKAIPKEWVDKIKTENSPKIVVNIFRNYVLIKGNPYKFSILENNFLMRNLQNQLVLLHGIPIYNKNYQNVKQYVILYLII